MFKDELLNKINAKTAKIGVVGLGYVGLPLAATFLNKGFTVTGFDIDATKIDMLTNGVAYIEYMAPKPLQQAIAEKHFAPTTDFANACETDVLILCVPTPLTKYRDPDLSFVVNSLKALLPYLRKGQALCLESTTYPGTTSEILAPEITALGFEIGRDFFLIYSPEREDPGNPDFSTGTIPKVCGGYTSACLEIGAALYGQVISKVVPVSSTQVAEMVKIFENTFRAINIALVNELKLVAHKMDIDIFEVINAAATKPFGFMPFYPGPGLGGHCIPIDPFYLTWKAREFGINTKLIELSGEINSTMPHYVVARTALALNTVRQSLAGSKILILGVAYKKNVNDMRESPSLELIKHLQEVDAEVAYSDPHVPALPQTRRHKFQLRSVAADKNTLSQYDCVVVATDHDKFDWDEIKAHSKLIVDTRGVYIADNKQIFRA